MKVAVCLSGLFRGIQVCLPTWQQYLLNQNHQFEFFICTGPTVEWCSGVRISNHLAWLQNAVKVIDIKIEEPVSKWPPIAIVRNFNTRNYEHFFSMFHKIKVANQLKMEYERQFKFQYDMVMRFRPDTYLKSPLLLDSEFEKWHVPKHGDFGGLNDQMAWSSSKNMDYYSGLYDNIESYLEQDPAMLLNPEYLMKRHWEKSGCAMLRPNILYQLARDNTNMLPDNETREKILIESNGTRHV